MHPDVVSDKPGRCPKCGMDLIPVKKNGKSRQIEHQHGGHHTHMAEDFKKRFFVVLPLTLAVLALHFWQENLTAYG